MGQLLDTSTHAGDTPGSPIARSISLPTVSDHFDGKPDEVRELYQGLIDLVEKFGPVEQDPKKTSIHLNRKTAFAGITVRREYLLLTIKSDRTIKSSRIFKSEKTASNRYHHEVKIGNAADLNPELQGWLRAAYNLSA